MRTKKYETQVEAVFDKSHSFIISLGQVQRSQKLFINCIHMKFIKKNRISLVMITKQDKRRATHQVTKFPSHFLSFSHHHHHSQRDVSHFLSFHELTIKLQLL